jgi:Beta/Gamma crystallin
MNNKIKMAFGITALLLAGQAAAQITFYQGEGFRGRSFTTGKPINNFERTGFNDAVSSIIVDAAMRISAGAAWCCVPATTAPSTPWE